MLVKINVLHISQAAGGIETHLLQVLEHLDRERFQPFLICPRGNGRLFEKVQHLNVPVFSVPMVRRIAPFKDIYAGLAISRLVGEIGPDIIHVHSSKAGVLGRLAAAHHGMLSIYTPNAYAFLGATGLKRWLYLRIEKSLRSKTWRLLACGPSEMDRSLRDVKYQSDKVVSVNNSLACSTEPANRQVSTSESLSALMVGRFIHQKNPEMLVRVARLVTRELPHVKFLLVGGGYQATLGKAIQLLTAKLGLAGKLTVLDWMEPSALESLMLDAAVIVVPSRFDGLPFLPLEAMLLGKPVVGTNVDGVKDTIVDGETGYLVELDDDDAMASRLIELFQDPQLRTRMGEAGRRRVDEQFNIERNIRQLEDIYAEAYREKEAVISSRSPR